MATVTFKGTPVTLAGTLPAVGSQASEFNLVASDLSEKTLASFAGKKKILAVNPSYDTGTCQKAARMFNQTMSARSDVAVLLISADLPFAQARFCEADGLKNVTPLSSFRSSFAADYGFNMVSGPLQGLTARGVVVLDEQNKVIHSQLVPEVTQEPDYDSVSKALG
jgi:thioredoxin-dependent peroxiredoxin